MDDSIATFLAFTATEDPQVAKQFLDISGGNLEYAVQLFMESGNNQAPSHSTNDEEFAQRLQSEAYQDTGVREADANVHRHETLLDSFAPYNPIQDHAGAIFGDGRVGIFNQRFDEDHYDDAFEDQDMVDSDEDRVVELYSDDENDNNDDGEVIEVDSEGETVRPTRRSRVQRDRMSELTSTQRRLAELFKPPFELIMRASLDAARQRGREEKKWIIVNIQDQTEFQCQVLNRDFWSDPSVKEIVRREFIFLQYQHDSPHGQSYSNFYSIDAYPHISILDPMTGERVFKWKDGEVPDVEEWISDVELFLEKFSLLPGSSNPIVEHDVRIDPDAMTEEQQIEYAMKQSIGANGDSATKSAQTADASKTSAEEEVSLDPFEAIVSQDHAEPASGPSTRIQIRFPNGKRLIHKFAPEEDTVLTIYQWLKFVLSEADESAYGLGNEAFTISCAGKPRLLDMVDQTIKEAGLGNASILLEKM